MRGRAGKRLSTFAGALLREWGRLGLPVAGERVVVAVSGGADSVGLVLGLEELVRAGRLAVPLTVAHLDHGLREESVEDARWVEGLAGELGVEVEVGRVDVRERVAGAGGNLEQAARGARYEFLREVAERKGARVVLTGHTMDDQAETVLLRLLRGSGAEGLSGMKAVRALDVGSEVRLARPLLRWARRAETEEFCRERGVDVRRDAMNEDESFARVRVRRRLLPLMLTFNPRAVEALARAAELLREDAETLNAAARELLEAAGESESGKRENERGANAQGGVSAVAPLDVKVLSSAPSALRRRALRLWVGCGRGDLRRLELAHLAGVEKLLEGERGGRVAELPGGSFVERRRGRLTFHVK
ncbi:MAG TPA: tRNA lysidine(34) synthetase TilS [Pyrinomonadaceae bacterium]|nr:tRNA lysidine(34) synthetase TilS [Pyrinomonadaceae bacterium]